MLSARGKTEKEAWLKVKSVVSGNGLEAFVKLYNWLTGTSGKGLSERARAIMAPTTPKSEGDIAEAVDRGLDGLRILENHPGYGMHVNLRVTALKQLMVGRARYQFEMWEESLKSQGSDDMQWKWILNKVQDYATRRRLEANMKGQGNGMEFHWVDGGGDEDWWQGNYHDWG